MQSDTAGVTARMPRDRVRATMAGILEMDGRTLPADDHATLREIPFRSLEFSELVLRVEEHIGRELNFDAAGLRRVRTVADVLDLLDELQAS